MGDAIQLAQFENEGNLLADLKQWTESSEIEQMNKAQKKIAVFRAPWLKKVGSVGRQQLRVGRGALNTAIFFFLA